MLRSIGISPCLRLNEDGKLATVGCSVIVRCKREVDEGRAPYRTSLRVRVSVADFADSFAVAVDDRLGAAAEAQGDERAAAAAAFDFEQLVGGEVREV